jgi:hypothetical protein
MLTREIYIYSSMTAKGVQHESYAKQKLTVRENSKLCDKFDKIYLS